MARILLIDDHAAVGVIIKTYLKVLGFDDEVLDLHEDVDSAISAHDQSKRYAAVLLDNFVPPAFDFRQSLQLLEKVIGEAPVILFSGLSPQDFGERPEDAAISAILIKDELSPTRLRDVLDGVGVRP